MFLQALRYPTKAKLNNCNRVSPDLRLFSLFNFYKKLYILIAMPNGCVIVKTIAQINFSF